MNEHQEEKEEENLRGWHGDIELLADSLVHKDLEDVSKPETRPLGHITAGFVAPDSDERDDGATGEGGQDAHTDQQQVERAGEGEHPQE